MNIPVRVQCQSCHEPHKGTFLIGSGDIEWTCKQCGAPNLGILSLDSTIGSQVWAKASYELNETRDFSIAVILAATAVDCELFHLYRKWTYIDQIPQGMYETETEWDEKCAAELRKVYGIQNKFNAVGKLVAPPEGFEGFVSARDEWRATISRDFPELEGASLTERIERHLFWPRNRILHAGIPANHQQAERCVKIAHLCLRIFSAMDHERRNDLESRHRGG